MGKKELMFTGSDTEGGITSGYQMNDGVKLKVPYSFFGSIYDEMEEKALMAVLKQESQTMGPQVALFQKEFAKKFEVKHAFATSNCTTGMHAATQALGIGPKTFNINPKDIEKKITKKPKPSMLFITGAKCAI